MAFKIFRKNCCGLDVHKTWIYACVGITDICGRTDYKQARFSSFSKGLKELCCWLAKYGCSDVCMESTGKYWIPVFNIPEKTDISVILAHPKYTKPQKGNKTDRKDAKWICDLFMCDMIKPSFIPPADIRHLRDLVRYRFKLTCMITGEKNRAQNCLTVSNLKLDDVFSDVFGKSSRSITEYMLAHPGELFDVTPFVDGRCKTPVEEIQAAVDGVISPEQAVKLRQCLNHIDELEKHLDEIEQEILHLSDKYQAALDLIRTTPGFNKNPMTAIQILSEIDGDMSVFPTAKHLVSWAGCCPRNDQSNQKIKSTRISRAGTYIKPVLVQRRPLQYGQPIPRVLLLITASHRCPFSHSHQTFLPDPAVTSLGLIDSFFSRLHCSISSILSFSIHHSSNDCFILLVFTLQYIFFSYNILLFLLAEDIKKNQVHQAIFAKIAHLHT